MRHDAARRLPLAGADEAPRRHGPERFRCSQSYDSLVGRELERHAIPLLQDQGAGAARLEPARRRVPLRQVHADRRRRGRAPREFDFPPVNKEKAFDVLDVLGAVAASHEASVAQIALAWLLSRDVVTSAIIGARKLSQLEDNLKAVDVALTEEDRRALDEVSKLAPEYPAWMEAPGSDRRPGERRF